MKKRLIEYRNQPDLVHQDMINWLQFLRKLASERGVKIIDTVHHSFEEIKTIVFEE